MRPRRNPPGGYIYHVLNRANRRCQLFWDDSDYVAFMEVIRETLLLHEMRILQNCIMPNHWHFVLWPEQDGQLADFMHYLTTTHAARWNKCRDMTGTGHVYQGPYKFFPVEDDDHYLKVSRYAVRNALRAGLVTCAEDWIWCSLNRRQGISLSPGPIPLPYDWIRWVNDPQTDTELRALRCSVNRGTPYGSTAWRDSTAKELGLMHTLRQRGRPRVPR